MAYSRFGINLTVKRNAPTQYAGFNFNSMVFFEEKCLGCNEDGILTLFDADADSYVSESQKTDIVAYFSLMQSDLGYINQKRCRKIFLGGESDGDVDITMSFDEETPYTKRVSPSQSSEQQRRVKANGRRKSKGSYFKPKISNVSGSKFSIDSIDGIFNILPRKPRGS